MLSTTAVPSLVGGGGCTAEFGTTPCAGIGSMVTGPLVALMRAGACRSLVVAGRDPVASWETGCVVLEVSSATGASGIGIGAICSLGAPGIAENGVGFGSPKVKYATVPTVTATTPAAAHPRKLEPVAVPTTVWPSCALMPCQTAGSTAVSWPWNRSLNRSLMPSVPETVAAFAICWAMPCHTAGPTGNSCPWKRSRKRVFKLSFML